METLFSGSDEMVVSEPMMASIHSSFPEYTVQGMARKIHPVFRHHPAMAASWDNGRDMCPDVPCGNQAEPDCIINSTGYLAFYKVIEDSTGMQPLSQFEARPIYKDEERSSMLFSQLAEVEKYGPGKTKEIQVPDNPIGGKFSPATYSTDATYNNIVVTIPFFAPVLKLYILYVILQHCVMAFPNLFFHCHFYFHQCTKLVLK